MSVIIMIDSSIHVEHNRKFGFKVLSLHDSVVEKLYNWCEMTVTALMFSLI